MFNFDGLMIAFTELGGPQSISIFCFILAVFLISHKKPHHFLQFVIFMSLGALSVWALKIWLQIPRPIGGLITEYGYGFPSGHATMATLFSSLLVYAYISHVETRVGKYLLILFGLIFAGAVSYSRIYLGVHSWVDVAGGICLGTFWFILSVIFYTRIQKKRTR